MRDYITGLILMSFVGFIIIGASIWLYKFNPAAVQATPEQINGEFIGDPRYDGGTK